jgi:hypothetical protein
MINIEIRACEHGLCLCMMEKIQNEVLPESHAQGFKEGYESVLENMEMITDAVAKIAKSGKDHKPMVITLVRRLSALAQVQPDGTVEVNPEAYKLVN